MDNSEKIRENLARRKARRRGLEIHKSRTRDKLALDYQKWKIVNATTGIAETDGHSATLDQVEQRIDQGPTQA